MLIRDLKNEYFETLKDGGLKPADTINGLILIKLCEILDILNKQNEELKPTTKKTTTTK